VLEVGTDAFRSQPNVAAVFLNHGGPFKPGDRLTQSDLAATLRAISDGGARAFYHGPIAAAVADASKAHGGLLTAADFAAYTVTESPPVTCAYRGYTIMSAPPPSSGASPCARCCAFWNLIPCAIWVPFEPVGALPDGSDALRISRSQPYLGDPAFIDNPTDRLISTPHAAAIRSRIAAQHATPSGALAGDIDPAEHAMTTHYSIVDVEGNAVSVTYTINDDFGAKVIAGDTGFFLNDEMDDFTAKPGAANLFGLVQGKANAIAPGKRPLSSMTPTIVLKDGKPVLVGGDPRRIPHHHHRAGDSRQRDRPRHEPSRSD